MKSFEQYLAESVSLINFDKLISKFYNQPKQQFDPIRVQQWLVEITKSTDWKNFVDRCQFGQCDSIAGLVKCHFEHVEIVDCQVGDQFNHWFNIVNNVKYDFGKGTLVDNGKYVIEQGDLYSVEHNPVEQKLFDKFIKRAYFCKAINQYI